MLMLYRMIDASMNEHNRIIDKSLSTDIYIRKQMGLYFECSGLTQLYLYNYKLSMLFLLVGYGIFLLISYILSLHVEIQV